LTTHNAIISVGSNIGDKPGNCRRGIERLVNSGQTKLVGQSFFYRTSPVGYLDQDWFVNTAVKIETELEPLDLLEALQIIQQEIGRTKSEIRFGPRVLDLDSIYYDSMVLKTPELEIPHARMHKRRFVLQPICDIDPGIVHPVLKQTVTSLLNRIDDKDQEIQRYR